MPPIVHAVVSDMAHEINVTAVIADELIEAVVLRMEIVRVCRITLVPFTKHARDISRIFQNLSKRGFGEL
jgi:hypothetical protein